MMENTTKAPQQMYRVVSAGNIIERLGRKSFRKAEAGLMVRDLRSRGYDDARAEPEIFIDAELLLAHKAQSKEDQRRRARAGSAGLLYSVKVLGVDGAQRAFFDSATAARHYVRRVHEETGKLVRLEGQFFVEGGQVGWWRVMA